MPSSFSRIVLHTTFSTKFRRPLTDPSIEQELYRVMNAEFKRQGALAIRINGVPDHIHAVHTLPRTQSLAHVIQAVKAVSSGWIKSLNP